jgi:hypothetical protein
MRSLKHQEFFQLFKFIADFSFLMVKKKKNKVGYITKVVIKI